MGACKAKGHFGIRTDHREAGPASDNPSRCAVLVRIVEQEYRDQLFLLRNFLAEDSIRKSQHAILIELSRFDHRRPASAM